MFTGRVIIRDRDRFRRELKDLGQGHGQLYVHSTGYTRGGGRRGRCTRGGGCTRDSGLILSAGFTRGRVGVFVDVRSVATMSVLVAAGAFDMCGWLEKKFACSYG